MRLLINTCYKYYKAILTNIAILLYIYGFFIGISDTEETSNIDIILALSCLFIAFLITIYLIISDNLNNNINLTNVTININDIDFEIDTTIEVNNQPVIEQEPEHSTRNQTIKIISNNSIILKFDNDDDDEIICSICLEKINDKCNNLKLKCAHIFHNDCINTWLNTNNKCPLCRIIINNYQ